MEYSNIENLKTDDLDGAALGVLSDFTFLGSNYNFIKTSDYEIVISLNNSTFFDLHLFQIHATDKEFSSLLEEKEFISYSNSIFILSENLKNWIPILLSKNAFDVMLTPVRRDEIFGKIEYFFSDPFQSNLMKRNYNFKIELTKKEQKLFDFLIDYPKGVTRDQLMDLCWKNISVHPKTLDVHLFNLRQKLELVGGEISFKNGCWKLILKNTISNN